MNLGSFRTLLPISVWKDSSFSSKEALRDQVPAPYMGTGMYDVSHCAMRQCAYAALCMQVGRAEQVSGIICVLLVVWEPKEQYVDSSCVSVLIRK